MSPSSSDASSAAGGSRAAGVSRTASPWAHVVRGESEPVAAAPSSPPPPAAVISVNFEAEASGSGDRVVAESSSERVSENNGNEKRSPWSSKPPNGVIEVGPVMGAVSWPALGESSKASPKLSPPDSIKTGGDDGSSPSDSAPPVPVVANHHQMKVNSNNPNPNSNRQKPTKPRGGSGTSSNNGLQVNGEPISAPPPPASGETQRQILLDNPAGQRQEPSPRDMHNNRNHNNWDHGSSSRGSGFSPHSHGDHHRPFNRRFNNGGAGGPHNGGRRDPDRGGYSNHSNDWNNPSPRHMPPPSLRMHHPRPQFIRTPPPPPPAGTAPFIGPPPPVRPFVPPLMGFPEIPSPVFYVPAPPPPAFVAAHPVVHAMPPAVLLNAADYQSPSVLKQIEYYFSNDNLCKDMYLRRHMDEQGWVPVALIAGFNRLHTSTTARTAKPSSQVRQLTNGIPDIINYILDLVRTSELVEVQGERIRRRGDWKIWILHPQLSQHGSTSSLLSSPEPNVENVMDCMQNVVLEESVGNHNSGGAIVSEVVGRSASGNIINQSLRGDSNEDRQVRSAGHSGSDQ